jgi:hypothetical protein
MKNLLWCPRPLSEREARSMSDLPEVHFRLRLTVNQFHCRNALAGQLADRRRRFATFGATTIEGSVFETVLNFAQIVASIAQCSSEHMACIFCFGLGRFTDLFKVFESYFQFLFQKIAPYLERHLRNRLRPELLRFECADLCQNVMRMLQCGRQRSIFLGGKPEAEVSVARKRCN